jgi:rifampicin phosphotransferase
MADGIMQESPQAGFAPIPLAECARRPLGEVGAKARHLAEALAAGHPVPPGIVLPCPALADGLTDAVVEAAWGAAQALGEGPVAVRSSGVAEDGAEQSFAGQFRTVLNVKGREALAEALRACLASADSAQVRSYGRNGAQPMALLVQRQVEARSAGVAFSANPVTGARDEVVINAVHGLGDRLVNGEVTPEELTVRGDEVERGVAGAGGARRAGAGAGEPVLDDGRAREVARAARSLEAAFGVPQDIEWAFDEAGRLAILQSRPITALPPEPIPVPLDPPPGTWIRSDHHFAPSPMFFGLFCDTYDRAQQRALAKFALPVTEVRSLMLGGHLYTQTVLEGGDEEGTPPGWLLWILSRVLPSMRRMNRQARQVFDTRLHHQEMREWEEVHRPRFQALLREFDPHGLEALGDEALLERWEAVVELAREGARVHAETIGNWIAVAEFDLFGRRHLGWDLATALQAMQGWSRATTVLRDSLIELAETHLSREEAAGALRAMDAAGGTGTPGAFTDAPLPLPFRNAFEAWFQANRLRIQAYDLKNPTLGETPEVVHRLLREALEARAEDRPHPRLQVDAERERILAEARDRLAGTPSWRSSRSWPTGASGPTGTGTRTDSTPWPAPWGLPASTCWRSGGGSHAGARARPGSAPRPWKTRCTPSTSARKRSPAPSGGRSPTWRSASPGGGERSSGPASTRAPSAWGPRSPPCRTPPPSPPPSGSFSTSSAGSWRWSPPRRRPMPPIRTASPGGRPAAVATPAPPGSSGAPGTSTALSPAT